MSCSSQWRLRLRWATVDPVQIPLEDSQKVTPGALSYMTDYCHWIFTSITGLNIANDTSLQNEINSVGLQIKTEVHKLIKLQ